MAQMESGSITRRKLLAGAALGLILPARVWAQVPPNAGRDVIVLIPGITGSVLSVRGREVWSPAREGVVRALFTLGASLDSLRLESDPIGRLTLDDGVVATRLVEDVHLIPGLWKIDGYTKLISRISSKPGVRPGENFFQFAYDWRRDNRVSAAQLQISTHKWLNEWRLRSGNPSAKLVFLTHSMGGLVARYFIECMEGWKSTRRLISFGTPYGGSVNSLKFLHQGMGAHLGRVRLLDLTELMRSFTSVYQLLPIYPCIEEAGIVKRIGEASPIAHVDVRRAANALGFHREIAAAVIANEKLAKYRANRYQINPVVGIGQKTAQYVRKAGSSLTFIDNFPGDVADGDGTVPQPSATPLELQGKNNELFIAEAHSSLQNSAHVYGQVSALIDSSSREWKAYRSLNIVAKASVSVPDATLDRDPVVISGQLDLSEYVDEVELEVREIYSGTTVAQSTATADSSGTFGTQLAPLPAGTYRATARFTRRQAPDFVSVTDVMCILPTGS